MKRQAPTGQNYVVDLREAGQLDPVRVGGKAAKLGELMAMGFPVPEGCVFSTDAFKRVTAVNNLSTEASPSALLDAKLPDDVREAIEAINVNFGDASLAVRSSGIAEDLSGASFAGQYETVLGVKGRDALEKAVLRCWASAFSPRVVEYRKAKGVNGVRMAVIVQRLVNADSAGVAFTANPTTGDRGEVVVNAVKGLGERLVSGQVTPDEWVVRTSDAICKSSPEGAITRHQVLEIADLARRVEKHFGAPQDIEWAFSGDRLYLLQARPITALEGIDPEERIVPVPVPLEVPEGFWQRDEVFHPRPFLPMDRSVSLPLENAVFRRVFADFGIPLEGLEGREIGGWYYSRIVPPGGKDRSPPPAWLMPVLIRVVPQIRSRIRTCVEAIRSDKQWRYVNLWYDGWLPEAISEATRLKAVALASLSDKDLEEHLSACMKFLKDGYDKHFNLLFPWLLIVSEFVFASKELLQWNEQKVLGMVSGLSVRSTEPSIALAELATLAKGKPGVRRLILQSSGRMNEDLPEKLAETDSEFAEGFNRYMNEYGHRSLRYVVSEPTLAEEPILILNLIRDQITRAYDPASNSTSLTRSREGLITQAKSALASDSLARFERVLGRAERAYPTLEDSQFYTAGVPRALFRYALLEIGDRLAKRGSIQARDDVFFLELEEARSALRGERRDLRQLVSKRKGERAWIEAHPGPNAYGKPPGPPPPLDPFPPEVRFVMKALMWGIENVLPSAGVKKASDQNVVTGVAASPGRYTGRVRIVMDEAQFGKLQAGDVLVCPVTTPVWSVLFPSIGALVTDRGGILSHPAIIAREYRIPAVVATGDGTQLLHDGQVVTVDGDKGQVAVEGVASGRVSD